MPEMRRSRSRRPATRESLVSRSRKKRNAAHWAVRGVLGLVATVIGLASVSDTLANVIVRIDPARAHTLSRGDGRITAKLAERHFSLKPSGDPDSHPARLARLALRQDATAAEALSVLGLQAQIRNDTEEARRLFTYSQSLSRRELQPRIWAIEEAVSRGDIAGALEHYDLALRTSRAAPDLLFPVLASAIAEPRVRAELIADLAERRTWGVSFLEHLATAAVEPQAAARFLQEAQQAGLSVDEGVRMAMVNALFTRGDHIGAWKFYASIRRHVDRRQSRDPGFAHPSDAPAFFDWAVVNSAGLSTSIQPRGQGGLVDFSVAPGTGGPVLQQIQMLPRGEYRLEGRSSGVEQPQQSLPYWVLTCQDGRELGRVSLRNAGAHSTPAGEPFTGRFSVPANCPVQTLALIARPSDKVTGVTGQILRAQLMPVARLRRGGAQ